MKNDSNTPEKNTRMSLVKRAIKAMLLKISPAYRTEVYVKNSLNRMSKAMEQMDQKTSGAIDELDRKTSDAVDALDCKTSDAIEQMGHKTSDAIEQMGHKTSDAIEQMGHKTSDAIERMNQKMSDTIDEVDRKLSDAMDELDRKTSGAAAEMDCKTSNAIERMEQEVANAIQKLNGEASSAIGQADNATASALVQMNSKMVSAIEETNKKTLGAIDQIKIKANEHYSQLNSNDTQTRKEFSSLLDTVFELQDALYFTNGVHYKGAPRDSFLNDIEVKNAGDGIHTIKLLGKDLLFSDATSFWCVSKELFGSESYYFSADTDAPRVLDCGAHIGLASIYVKHLYPNARVTAFEPDPRNFSLAKQNLHNAGLDDVELIEKAVGIGDGQAEFYRAVNMSMGGSLSTRMKNRKDGVEEITVNMCRLKDYVRDEKIDFLKLDVEGIEDRVIADCTDCIANVNYLFIEFHVGNDLPMSRMLTILNVLEDNGFDYNVTQSDSYVELNRRRPLVKVRNNVTHLIYAKNKEWK